MSAPALKEMLLGVLNAMPDQDYAAALMAAAYNLLVSPHDQSPVRAMTEDGEVRALAAVLCEELRHRLRGTEPEALRAIVDACREWFSSIGYEVEMGQTPRGGGH